MKTINYSYSNDDEYKYVKTLPCELKFSYIDENTIRYLQSLKLTSYEGYDLLLHRSYVNGDMSKNVYFISVILDDEEQRKESRNVPDIKCEKWRFHIRQYVLLLECKPVYIYLGYSGWADGCSIDILEVISDYHSKNDIVLIRKIISECAMLEFSGGPEYWYNDEHTIFKLSNEIYK